jgi:hypothetical protein
MKGMKGNLMIFLNLLKSVKELPVFDCFLFKIETHTQILC